MMEQFGKVTGRNYKPYQYVGAADAGNLIVMMGAGCDPTQEYIETHPNCNVGLLKIRLYIPFSIEMINNVSHHHSRESALWISTPTQQ